MTFHLVLAFVDGYRGTPVYEDLSGSCDYQQSGSLPATHQHCTALHEDTLKNDLDFEVVDRF